MSIIDKILGAGSQGGGPMTAQNFFVENNQHGYITKPEFIEEIQRIAMKDKKLITNHELFFDYIKSKIKINSQPVVSTDRDGQKVIWAKVGLPNSDQNLKVAVFGKLVEFLKHYQQGLIEPNFTFEELYMEAKNQ